MAGIKDIVGFHGTTVDELEEAFHTVVDDYIAISEKTGRPAQKPYSGNLMLRVPSDVHAAVARAAQVSGKSIKQWAAGVLETKADYIVSGDNHLLSLKHYQGIQIVDAKTFINIMKKK